MRLNLLLYALAFNFIESFINYSYLTSCFSLQKRMGCKVSQQAYSPNEPQSFHHITQDLLDISDAISRTKSTKHTVSTDQEERPGSRSAVGDTSYTAGTREWTGTIKDVRESGMEMGCAVLGLEDAVCYDIKSTT